MEVACALELAEQYSVQRVDALLLGSEVNRALHALTALIGVA